MASGAASPGASAPGVPVSAAPRPDTRGLTPPGSPFCSCLLDFFGIKVFGDVCCEKPLKNQANGSLITH